MTEFEPIKKIVTFNDFKRSYELLVTYKKTPFLDNLPLDPQEAKNELIKIWPELNQMLKDEGIIATEQDFEKFVENLLTERK